MNARKETQTYIGRIYEGKDNMIISTNDGYLVESGALVNRVLTSFNNKDAKVTITVEIEEIN